MNNFIRKKDIENLEQMLQELLIEQRRTISEISEKCFLFKEFASLYEVFSQKVRLSACTFGRDSGFVGY